MYTYYVGALKEVMIQILQFYVKNLIIFVSTQIIIPQITLDKSSFVRHNALINCQSQTLFS